MEIENEFESLTANKNKESKENYIKPKDEFFNLLESLPKELAELWGNRLDNLIETNPEEAVRKIKEVIKKRTEVLNTFHNIENKEKVFEDNLSLEEKAKNEELLSKIIHEAIFNGLNMIGRGKVSKVFESEIDSDFCYKLITSLEAYKRGNDVSKEAEFLDKIILKLKNDARVPKVYYYHMGTDKHFYVMERLDAIDLSKVLSGEMVLPHSFDLEGFLDKMKQFIKEMHGIGIYHRDIGKDGHNIMVNIESSSPFFIDFGLSIDISNSEDGKNPYKDIGTGTIYPNDDNSIKIIESKLRKVYDQNK